MADFEKDAVNLKLSLAIDTNLTWGKLFRFVDLARKAGVDLGDAVPLEYSDLDNSILEGFAVYLAADNLSGGAQPNR